MEDKKQIKISLKTAIIIICIIIILIIGIIAIVKFNTKKDKMDNPTSPPDEPITGQPLEEKQSLPSITIYDENGTRIKTIEINSDDDLKKLNTWIDLCDFFLEDEGTDKDLKNISIRRDIAIKYNDSIEIYIQLGQEKYCYYVNKEKNISFVSDMFDDQYAWIEEKIGGLNKEGNISGISYKIYDDYNQGGYDYSKRGYYWDMFKQPDSPKWYVITSGERPEQSYIIIQDIKIDIEKNVEVIVKEHIGTPIYPDVIGYKIPKIYPACCIEFLHDSAESIKSISIKNTEGEVFEKLN